MYCRQQDFHGSDCPDSARSINILIYRLFAPNLLQNWSFIVYQQ